MSQNFICVALKSQNQVAIHCGEETKIDLLVEITSFPIDKYRICFPWGGQRGVEIVDSYLTVADISFGLYHFI